MTSQKDLNKDMVALLSSVTDSIHQLRSEVVALRSDMNSQHMRNNNFNDRLINLEENKMKQYIVDIKGVIIPEDEWDNTSIYRVDNSTGEWCEISFDKDDIVKIEEERI